MNFANRTIWTADNIEILPGIDSECVDLVYLDPPFNSNRDYAAPIGSKAAGAAFKDTWTLSDLDVAAMGRLADTYPSVYAVIDAAGQVHGKGMMSYLVMMADRLVECHRILKPTGNLYLHCDPTAGHYIKFLMDSIFGANQFRSQVIWRRANAKGLAFRGYPNNADYLLYYTKGDNFTWNRPYRPHDPEYVKKFYRHIEPRTGRRYQLDNLVNPNKDRPNLTYEFLGVTRVWRWTKERMQAAYEKGIVVQTKPGAVPRLKRYLDEMKGNPVDTIWEDVKPLQAASKERTGYPTQKPLALLERIIKASSNEGDVVLDPFCGCATTCIAAEKQGRQWAGIDISPNAVNQVRYRMAQTNLALGIEGRTLSVHTAAPSRSDGTKMPRRQIKHTLYGQQEGNCNGCREHFAFHMLEVDHVWPRSKGGPNTLENSQLLCRHCNSLKATGTMDDLAVKLSNWQRGSR